MPLSDILPREVIEGAIRAPLSYREFHFAEIDGLIAAEPDLLFSGALRIWDRVVTASDVHPDPMMLADHVNRGDPRMFEAISGVVGEDAIRDIYVARADVVDDTLTYTTAAQLAVAHTFPSDLLLIDILMSNPYRPLPPRRVTATRSYHGYGVLATILDNAVTCARELNCTALVLVAASRALARLFQRHGFVVDNTSTGQTGRQAGHGLPMNRPL